MADTLYNILVWLWQLGFGSALLLIFSLLLTIIIEGAFIAFIFRKSEHWRRYIYYSFLCNLATNPALNLILFMVYAAYGDAYIFEDPLITLVIITGEIAVVIIETLIYRYLAGFKLQKALLLSFALNLTSFAAGLLLSEILLAI